MPNIKLVNVYKNFSIKRVVKKALAGVNLDINQGDFILISGPSGCGKTTLLASIGGLIMPDEGSLYINKHNIAKVSKGLINSIRGKYISYVFQNNILINDFTSKENIFFPFQVKQEINKELMKKTIHYLDYFGMLGLSEVKVKKLSGGEKQIVNFIRAILPDSNIILADEPNSELDHATTIKMYDLLEKINQEKNTTVVLVSHYPEALDYAKEFYKMESGKLISYKKLR